jgi:hypothetical protein
MSIDISLEINQIFLCFRSSGSSSASLFSGVETIGIKMIEESFAGLSLLSPSLFVSFSCSCWLRLDFFFCSLSFLSPFDRSGGETGFLLLKLFRLDYVGGISKFEMIFCSSLMHINPFETCISWKPSPFFGSRFEK